MSPRVPPMVVPHVVVVHRDVVGPREVVIPRIEFMPRTPPRELRPANVDAPGSSSSASSWDSAWNHSIWHPDGIFGRVGFRRTNGRC